MEFVFLLILLGLSLTLLGQTFQYEIPSFDTSGGPAMFPQYVLVMLIIAIVFLLIQLAWRKQGRTFVFGEVFRGGQGVFLGSLALYLLLLSPFGFLASTILFLLFTVNYLAQRYHGSLGTGKAIAVRSLVSVVVACTVNYLFAGVFRIMLPTGTIYP